MYKRILMPIDGSPNSEHTVGWGLDLAKVLGAEVTFLYVLEYLNASLYGVPTGGYYVADLERDLQDAGKALLAQATAQAAALGVSAQSRLLEGTHADQIILQEEKQHDLTLMATHSRRGLDRLFIGSVTEAVLRNSDQPHLILRSPDENAPDRARVHTTFKRLLFPVDGSACSDHAVAEGLQLAKVLGAAVTFLHALEVPVTVYTQRGSLVYEPSIHKDLKRVAEETLARALAQATTLDVEATVQLIDQGYVRPDAVILDAEGSADLTIIGTHGRRGFERALLGSVTERVLRQSAAPHLVLRCPKPEEAAS